MLCILKKKTINRVKRHPKDRKKIANHISNNGLVCRIHKEHLKLKTKKPNNPIQNGQRNWIDTSPKEIYKGPISNKTRSPLLTIQFSSVAQSCPTLCDPMNLSTPGLPVHHQLPEFTQTHVHPVSDAIQPSHPLSSPSPPAPSASQHQSLFQWVNSLHETAKVLEFQL